MTACPHDVRTSAPAAADRCDYLFDSAAFPQLTAEGEGFEPSETRNASAVFKTAALGH